jgi:hypothetical protein
MQVDHLRLTLRLTVPEKILQRQLYSSASKLGEELASVIDSYSRQHKLGYYPAIEFFRQVAGVNQDLIDSAEQVAWSISKLAREEVQSRLRPIFSTIKFQSIQTEAFALPSVRPNQPSAFMHLVKHYTPDTVKLELLISLLRKDDDLRFDAVEGYARKMIYRWLNDVFENVELTASVSLGE